MMFCDAKWNSSFFLTLLFAAVQHSDMPWFQQRGWVHTVHIPWSSTVGRHRSYTDPTKLTVTVLVAYVMPGNM